MAMQMTEAPTIPEWSLGERLQKARETAGMSREDMAAAFGVTIGAIGHWENDRGRPRGDLLVMVRRWSELTNVPVAWLLGVSTQMYEQIEQVPPLRLIHGVKRGSGEFARPSQPPLLSSVRNELVTLPPTE